MKTELVESCWTCGKPATHRVRGTALSYNVCDGCAERARGDKNVKSVEPIVASGTRVAPYLRNDDKLIDGYIRGGKVATDSIIIRNQPLAKEGVLAYGSKRKLKRWDDLKANIGLVVPIVDEHPPRNNGHDGLVAPATKRWGKTTIKLCPKGGNLLCHDPELFDGAPIKDGFSIGFRYADDPTPGVFNGNAYDSVQKGLVIDHVALTTLPRDKDMLLSAGDSDPCVFGRCLTDGYELDLDSRSDDGTAAVLLNSVGYDSFRFTASGSGETPARMASIIERLREDNPDTPADVIRAFAEQIYRNESGRSGI